MTRPTRLLVGAFALALIAPAFAQTVYTWKDDKGVTHYSDSPPPAGAKKKEIRNPVVTPTAAPVAATAKAETAKVDAASAEEKARVDEQKQAAAEVRAKQKAQACKEAQANISLLGGTTNVAVDRDGDGKADVVLDDKARQQEKANMQAVADANCNG